MANLTDPWQRSDVDIDAMIRRDDTEQKTSLQDANALHLKDLRRVHKTPLPSLVLKSDGHMKRFSAPLKFSVGSSPASW